MVIGTLKKLKQIAKSSLASPNFKKWKKIISRKKQTQDKCKRMKPYCKASEKLEYHMKLEK